MAGFEVITEAWEPTAPVPDRLKGRASRRPGIKMLEVVKQRLGSGDLGVRIDRLSRKLREKANRGQLLARPNPVLVVGWWNVFSVNAADFVATDAVGEPTSVFHSALYGRAGDQVTDGTEFEGAPLRTWDLKEPGILNAAGDCAAVLWLFQSGVPALATRAPGSEPALDPAAMRLLIEAFAPRRVEPNP
jgi:hypothetical protein